MACNAVCVLLLLPHIQTPCFYSFVAWILLIALLYVLGLLDFLKYKTSFKIEATNNKN